MKRYIRVALALLFSLMLTLQLPLVKANAYNEDSSSPEEKEVRVSSRLWELLFGGAEDAVSNKARTVIVGGDVFGARIKQGVVSIIEDNEGIGVKKGDILLGIDGRTVTKIKDVKDALSSYRQGELSLKIKRGKQEKQVHITPHLEGGEWKLGIMLRDTAAGIGTVTYIDPTDGSFGGLGHGICDTESGQIIEMTEGELTEVILGGLTRGEKGRPGELSGILTDRCKGQLYANTPAGIFGQIDLTGIDSGRTVQIGTKGDVHVGEAKIISTVKNGHKAEYTIEIFEIEKQTDGTKCFKIRVTDPVLLAITGGIVRGMSGSPIIQDGKLVGAVTHVMIADPTEGYGIFIENMLSAANEGALPKAA